MFVFEAIALVIFVGEIGKGARPDEIGVSEFMARPGGSAEMFSAGFSGHVAHLLNPDNAGEVVTPRLDLCRRREDCDAA